jgi:hypothetical protein
VNGKIHIDREDAENCLDPKKITRILRVFLRVSAMSFNLITRSALCLAILSTTVALAQPSSSALIGQALDSQAADLSAQGGLIDVMKTVENQTGIRLEALPAVWDALPWGQDTSVNVHVKNATVRQALDAITRRLGLTYTLGDEAVVLEPTAALSRLGRRATLEEIQALDLLAATPMALTTTSPTLDQLLQAVDAKLQDAKSPFAVQERGLDSGELGRVIQVARNATMMEAMEEITRQTDVTWYPWGHRLVVTAKTEAEHLLLSKRLTRRFHDVELAQVLTELSEYANLTFHYAPGVLRQVPGKYSRLKLDLDDATVEETLQTISGATGLQFIPTPDGISVTYSAPAADR